MLDFTFLSIGSFEFGLKLLSKEIVKHLITGNAYVPNRQHISSRKAEKMTVIFVRGFLSIKVAEIPIFTVRNTKLKTKNNEHGFY